MIKNLYGKPNKHKHFQKLNCLTAYFIYLQTFYVVETFFQVRLNQFGVFRLSENFKEIVVRYKIKSRERNSFCFQITFQRFLNFFEFFIHFQEAFNNFCLRKKDIASNRRNKSLQNFNFLTNISKKYN